MTSAMMVPTFSKYDLRLSTGVSASLCYIELSFDLSVITEEFDLDSFYVLENISS